MTSTIAIFGGGQLGRMLALAAHPLGLRVRCFDPSPQSPARDVAEVVSAAFDDDAGLEAFFQGADVVTYEFENIPRESLSKAPRGLPIHPNPRALEVSSDRVDEKNFFLDLRIPTAPFAAIATEEAFWNAVHHLGLPAVLKTRRLGYDGKGQAILRSNDDAKAAWAKLGSQQLILEGFVSFARELSMISVRGRSGEMQFYPVITNIHAEGILRRSMVTATHDPAFAEAKDYSQRILDALDYVGVLAVEFFEVDGNLFANEMAPRVHNSGHLTIEGMETSQFENHLRAIVGWPLGQAEFRGPCAMINVIGTLPDPERVLAISGAHLHLYGKAAAPRRKLGHVTLTAPTHEKLMERIAALDGWVKE